MTSAADPAPRAVSPAALAGTVADAAQAAAGTAAAAGHGVRLAVDGPVAPTPRPWPTPSPRLESRAVPVARVRAEEFLRARTLRLERGGDDPDAFFDGWYDLAALRREVLDPLGPGGRQEWLPGLRDPATDRPLRLPRRPAAARHRRRRRRALPRPLGRRRRRRPAGAPRRLAGRPGAPGRTAASWRACCPRGTGTCSGATRPRRRRSSCATTARPTRLCCRQALSAPSPPRR